MESLTSGQVARETTPGALSYSLDTASAATLSTEDVLHKLVTSEQGLDPDEATRRLAAVGLNALRAHGARFWSVLARQFRSYLLLLLLAAAAVSIFVGEGTNAGIILTIVGLSVVLGFVNEYRSERAVETLHSQIHRRAFVERAGKTMEVDVTELVPGDIVSLHVGDIVPADVRLLEAANLECDESVLTGESAAAIKEVAPVTEPATPLELPCVAFMGTVVHAGGGRGVVVQTGSRTAFGAIAVKLGERHELTSFQRGLQDFSRLLVTITGLLAGSILVLNVLLGRSFLNSLLFALAISVGLTPQLLPAIVTVSLATGARRLARRQVVVKRLVAIEDLGNIEVLFTDKTGTLTEGRTAFTHALDANGDDDPEVLELALTASDATGNALDRALFAAPQGAGLESAWRRIAEAPFDHERQLSSVLIESGRERLLVAKGAPEVILDRCARVPDEATTELERLFDSGTRVVAVASRSAQDLAALTPAEEQNLELRGLLCFSDPPKADVAESLARLADLGVEVKIVTGDNGRVAQRVCTDLGMTSLGTLTGAEIEELGDDALRASLPRTTIFARVTPEQKSRVIRAQRELGSDVGFLGDGVNDAIALHDADVGISVDTATDVAKDAADVVLVTKDLGILADGVSEGRRIFANTIKYVLMGTSSNFGNMFSAAGASLFLSFLPMLPSQILLNNLLYDVSELTIPTDHVDAELLARPSQWDIGFIRRFMAYFGPISSVYDFMTFGVLIYGFDAGETLFRSGWFVESLATQTLVIFVIRTRRVPFLRSRPSRPLLLTTAACAVIGVVIPYSPVANALGFEPLPVSLLGAIALMVVTYLALVEAGKYVFFKRPIRVRPLAIRRPRHERRTHRRAAAWSATRPRFSVQPDRPARPHEQGGRAR
ncbi:MAG TPA: magnesium-translocating P-type ATPase [Gaiellaceae bacterium]